MNISQIVQSDLELPRITTSAIHRDAANQCETYLKASRVIFCGTFIDIIADGTVFGEARVTGTFVGTLCICTDLRTDIILTLVHVR